MTSGQASGSSGGPWPRDSKASTGIPKLKQSFEIIFSVLKDCTTKPNHSISVLNHSSFSVFRRTGNILKVFFSTRANTIT